MRLLCLHGFGSNAQVSKAQSAPLYHALKRCGVNELSFIYWEGIDESKPVPGLRDSFAPPFYQIWDANSPESIAQTCQRIKTLIAEKGPFDGAFAFSEGASALLTTLNMFVIGRERVDLRFMILVAPMPPFDSKGQRRLDETQVDEELYNTSTVLIKGKEDPIWPLIGLTEGILPKEKTKLLGWSGGHAVPNSGEETIWEETSKEILRILDD